MLESRHVTASAPGKTILFGEHAVVYGKPAIAAAVDKRAYVTINGRDDNKIHVTVDEIGVSGFLNLKSGIVTSDNSKNPRKGILEYVLKSLIRTQTNEGLNVNVKLGMPIGAGLGSSAAVTVATIMASATYNQIKLTANEIADLAHQVELEVQGAASTIDTTLSTHGGVIYLAKNAEEITNLDINYELPIVIGHTSKTGNTGKLVEAVRLKRDAHPSVINPILDAVEEIVYTARESLIKGDHNTIGMLMNINHGLLDALGVNTEELSNMVFTARKAGAIGSKLTGSGGGGSIIAYCPGKVEEVVEKLNQNEEAFQISIATEGVRLE